MIHLNSVAFIIGLVARGFFENRMHVRMWLGAWIGYPMKGEVWRGLALCNSIDFDTP